MRASGATHHALCDRIRRIGRQLRRRRLRQRVDKPSSRRQARDCREGSGQSPTDRPSDHQRHLLAHEPQRCLGSLTEKQCGDQGDVASREEREPPRDGHRERAASAAEAVSPPATPHATRPGMRPSQSGPCRGSLKTSASWRPTPVMPQAIDHVPTGCLIIHANIGSLDFPASPSYRTPSLACQLSHSCLTTRGAARFQRAAPNPPTSRS